MRVSNYAGVMVCALFVSAVMGQPATTQATLKAGDPAPPFRVETFLKGAPIAGFEKGKVYVIEFWATNCGPCIEIIPHLTEVQRHFRDRGVTVCAVSIWEDVEITPATRERVAEFVRKLGDRMDYTVAYDGAAKFMDNAWMQANGHLGVPRTFVVDQQGTIAWIGFPEGVEIVLEALLAGRWNIQTGPQLVKDARKAFEQATGQYKTSLTAGDAAWGEVSTRHPFMSRSKTADRFTAMYRAEYEPAAFALGRQIVADGLRDKNPTQMQRVIVALHERPLRNNPQFTTLMLSAAETAMSLADPADAAPHSVLAGAYFAVGDFAKGRAAIARSLELSDPRVRDSREKFLKQIEQIYTAFHAR